MLLILCARTAAYASMKITSLVRLKTNANDPYAWEKMDEKKHLFLKNLSDLSIGQLKDLCDGVDRSFIAIWKAPLQSKPPAQNGRVTFFQFSSTVTSSILGI